MSIEKALKLLVVYLSEEEGNVPIGLVMRLKEELKLTDDEYEQVWDEVKVSCEDEEDSDN